MMAELDNYLVSCLITQLLNFYPTGCQNWKKWWGVPEAKIGHGSVSESSIIFLSKAEQFNLSVFEPWGDAV